MLYPLVSLSGQSIWCHYRFNWLFDQKIATSVAYPDPNPDLDPPDPHVFGPLGSGSFYHQAKIVRKTLIATILWLFLTFYVLCKCRGVPSKSNKQNSFFFFFGASWRSMTKIAGSGSTPKCHGSATLIDTRNMADLTQAEWPAAAASMRGVAPIRVSGVSTTLASSVFSSNSFSVTSWPCRTEQRTR